MIREYYLKNKGSRMHSIKSWIADRLFFFLQKKGDDCSYRKILIICNGHIGDTIMSTCVFREIKKNLPECRITAVVSEEAYPIVEKNKNIDKIVRMGFFWRNGKRNFHSLKQYIKFVKDMKNEGHDIGIALRSDFPNIATLYIIGVKNRAGYYNLDGGKPFLTKALKYPQKEIHASIADLRLVENALNIKCTDNFPEIFYDKDDIKISERFIKENSLKEYVCIVPNSASKLQTLHRHKFKEIIRWINLNYPFCRIILAGIKSDEPLIDWLMKGENNCLKLIDFNIRHLGIIFKKSLCTILHDGGTMHIAYAMHTPNLIVLWGPNPLEHVSPMGKYTLMHHNLDCSPCMRREKDCKMPEGKRCMDLITIEEIKSKIEKYLKARLLG